MCYIRYLNRGPRRLCSFALSFVRRREGQSLYIFMFLCSSNNSGRKCTRARKCHLGLTLRCLAIISSNVHHTDWLQNPHHSHHRHHPHRHNDNNGINVATAIHSNPGPTNELIENKKRVYEYEAKKKQQRKQNQFTPALVITGNNAIRPALRMESPFVLNWAMS